MIVVDVEGAVFNDGRYLMVVRGKDSSHATGALSFPGGKLEEDDGPEDALESALRREIAEEAGVTVHDRMTFVGSDLFDMDDGRKVLRWSSSVITPGVRRGLVRTRRASTG